MKDILCYNIDAESETGQPIAERFAVQGFPALILLAPDGSPEDSIGGYLPPDKFKEEIRRVRAGKNTASDLRKQVESDGKNTDKRFKLARKLKDLGDSKGFDAQMAEIRKLDPEGKSQAMRQLSFEDVLGRIDAGYRKTQTVDLTELKAFLEKETYAEILFDGWNRVAGISQFLAGQAEEKGKADEAGQLQVQMRKALATAWKHCPADQIAPFGNTVAWGLYESRDGITAEEKAFALEVARKAAEAAKDDVNVLDTLACCLHMNGKKDEALKLVLRCMELDPKNPEWKNRLEEFQK